MPSFAVILVEPKYPGNVGAAARAALNFDVRELIVVAPSFSLETDACRTMAVHAQSVIDDARVVDTFTDAADMVDYLAGTSAIETSSDRKHLRRALSLPLFADKIASVEGRVGIAFGREDYGLLNDEIRRCDALIHIPTADTYPSMNLSHAVAVTLYAVLAERGTSPVTRKADHAEKERLYEQFDRLLEATGYPEHKKDKTSVMFRRIIGRAMLSKWEYHTLMGVLKRARR
jgi:TrmH family RNA methyltransferase